jgi:hypothetical protein
MDLAGVRHRHVHPGGQAPGRGRQGDVPRQRGPRQVDAGLEVAVEAVDADARDTATGDVDRVLGHLDTAVPRRVVRLVDRAVATTKLEVAEHRAVGLHVGHAGAVVDPDGAVLADVEGGHGLVTVERHRARDRTVAVEAQQPTA